jgi:hypothetical protein
VRELGCIARLQVQTEPLKRGEKPDRIYDPSLIREVDELTVTEHGVLGHVDGEDEPIVDAHHRDHPRSRFRGDNGLSLGVLGHYTRLRERFGDHVVDGIAGENVLIDHPGRLTLEDLEGGVRVLSEEPVVLAPVVVAEPCLEFSRLVLGEEAATTSVREPLQELRGGMRGFYLGVQLGAGARLRVGDAVMRFR